MAKIKKLHTPEATSELGKLQPQSIELEEAVLGAVLLEKEAFDFISSVLKPDCFYKEQNGIIFKAILSLAAKSEPIDILTVTQELKRTNELEFVGGSFYISSLTNRIASSANIEYHARIVAQKYLQREVIRMSTESIKLAYEESTDAFELIDFIAAETNNLLNGIDSKQVKKIEDIKNEVIDNCEQALLSDKPSGVPISINSLQRITNGWRKSHFIILAGRPGMGKTAVALDFLFHPATLGVPTLMFSLEMSAVELAGRLMSKLSYISSQKINTNTTNSDELKAIKKDSELLNKLPIYIDDTPSLTIQRLRSKAHKAKREHNIELIVIDYLQLMEVGNEQGSNREQEISKISRGIKRLSKELNIPIIALSQLSRQVENRPGGSKRPQLSDLRESGSLEQDADMVVFLYRPEYYGIEVDEDNNSTHQLLEMIVAKFRGGECGQLKARWIGHTTSIKNWEQSEPEYGQPSIALGRIENNNDFLSRNDIEDFI